MAIFTLVYTSECLVSTAALDQAVEELVEQSRVRNKSIGVTGCLLLSKGRFAQVLEGEPAEVKVLMDSINRDSRHRDIRILDQGNIADRRFSGWALGYAGPSHFVHGIIADASISDQAHTDLDRLMRLMLAFRSGEES